jgi:hypothetical protein
LPNLLAILPAIALLLSNCATPPAPTPLQPVQKATALHDRWAMLLAKAARGPLPERAHEIEEPGPKYFAVGAKAGGGAPDVFRGSYRERAKTSFTNVRTEAVTDIDSILATLPSDAAMKQQYPELARKATRANPNVSPRATIERRNVRVRAWLYWTTKEADQDYHVILGNTPDLTAATTMMNSEVSGLPQSNPTQVTLTARRKDIRDILANHNNQNGLFDPPVPVIISGSLLWDGEHPYPNTVGPEDLPAPPKAWEIHPIRKIEVGD